jgi:OOP family OmpA-OmpF porin
LGGGLLVSTKAAAQEQPSLALNRYTPVPAGDRFFGVADAGSGEHLVPHAWIVLDYAHDPLVIEYIDEDGETRVDKVVQHQLYGHLGGAIGLWDIVKLDVSIPAALYQRGSDPSFAGATFESPSGFEFGDIRLGLRGQLWAQKDGLFTLGVGGYLWLPTGAKEDGSFTSDGTVRGLPMVNASGQIGSFVYAASTGIDIRDGQSYGGTVQGSRWQIGAAAGLLLGRKDTLQIGPELNLALTMDDVATETTNSEVLMGGKWRFLPSWVLGLGAGGGLAGGAGTPDFRALASFAFSPEVKKDSDGDGIFDRDDACPTVPGAASDDPSQHGCPAADRDRDGIVDVEDSCPADPGPASEEKEFHGCPDRDGDGVVDKNDACPDVAGSESSDPAQNGCPIDVDGDAIIDSEDACPEARGVRSDDPALHGCPTDRDKDGILDEVDACPDNSGKASEDPATTGCPDQDQDGIFDVQDACPTNWGRANDDPSMNGCPVVQVGTDQILILQKVQFALGSATIEAASFSLLDEIARVLREHPEIKKVEIQGHTDNRGSSWLNTKLSKERAASVLEATVKRGIDKERLRSKGFGSSVPIADNETAEGQEQNRRVEFKILKIEVEEVSK